MRIKHIFIDMDGVLANFIKSAYNVHGRQYTESEYPVGEYDIPKAMGLTTSQFWEPINARREEFWFNIPKYSWADDLIAMLREPWTIASSPSQEPESASGKVKWLRYYFGLGFRNYMLGHDKHHLAQSPMGMGTVLIDDNENQVNAFIREGGYGILFPQPWNNNYHHTHDRFGYVCIEYFKDVIKNGRREGLARYLGL
ncbi:MAG: hypothetical protein KGI50_05660 [Patescibacteria group bacterium]|nr:hypothetical protein [Patescibacteria group bacterium]MDE2438882.1 hypothetical protein [Patescibacteria group bacterium]